MEFLCFNLLSILVIFIILFIETPQICFGAVAKAKHLQTTAKSKTVNVSKTIEEDLMDKYYECQEKCKKDGEKLECGNNGWWFLNKCHRECEGVQISPDKENGCNPFDKLEFDRAWKCQVKCEGKPEKNECGSDGFWYENACRRECFEIELVDNKICLKLDKVEDCRQKCVASGYEPDCGVDGEYYDNKCQRECLGVKAGKEGKECRLQMHLAKYFTCQEKCSKAEQINTCGKAGYWYFNKCHLDCYGDKPGVAGKDCQT